MGKIDKALVKYAQERQAARLPKLTRADREALVGYDRKSGYLLTPTATEGESGNPDMEGVEKTGTFQRLIAHKLIFSSGKLTSKGLAESERLKKQSRAKKTPVDSDAKIKRKLMEAIESNDTIIELKEEIEPIELSDVIEVPPKKVVPLQKRPVAVTFGPSPQPENREASALTPPVVQETAGGRGRQASTIDNDRSDAVAADMREKPEGKKVEKERSRLSAPGVTFNDKMCHRTLVSLLDPLSYEAEQFKILRNTILFPAAGLTPQSILITSALDSEGKSFVSANLAVSIAMNINKHVLLIDCDLRKPDLHTLFGFGDGPGLSDYLAEHRSLDSLLVKTTVDKLTLLPGGTISPNPSELASSERMAAMLAEVKQRYQDRLIVVDSPPPSLAAETSFLSRQVDGILIVVKYGKTPREEVEDLMMTVGSDKIIGVVINYFDIPLSKSYGYGKYGRYGGYGKAKK